jgi:hypothetical protein
MENVKLRESESRINRSNGGKQEEDRLLGVELTQPQTHGRREELTHRAMYSIGYIHFFVCFNSTSYYRESHIILLLEHQLLGNNPKVSKITR